MKTTNYSISNSVITHYEESEKDCLNKMYPTIDIKNKYILFLQLELWYPFEADEINVEVLINEEIKYLPKYKIRTPYPNKNIRQISMVNKKRVCDYGMPLIFNSYNELCDLSTIDINWSIKSKTINNEDELILVKIQYKVDYIYEENKRIYVLHSKDNSLDSFIVMEGKDYYEKTVSNYIKEYDQIAVVSIYKNEITKDMIKGYDFDMVYIIKELNTKKINYCYIYKSNIILKPDIIGRDLFH